VNILYISQYFPPEMGAAAARVHELSREWVRGSHRVTVLTGFPNYPSGRVPIPYRRLRWRGTVREVVDGIDVVRTWLHAAPTRTPRARMLNYASFLASAVLRGAWLSRPDVVIGTSPQLLVGVAGYALARRFRCPFVFEVRDLWPESLPASGIGRAGSRLYRALESLARFLYRSADLVVPVTAALGEAIAAAAPRTPVAVVENGVDTDLLGPRRDADGVRGRLGFRDRFVVSYIGTIGFAHGLDVVLEAAAMLRRRPEVLFLLVGDGAERQRLQARAIAEGLGNVRFEGERPRAEIPDYIAASDVCLVPLRGAELFKGALPSKMLEFMACERPLVVGVAGLAARVIVESGGGLAIPPDDPAAMVAALEVLRGDPALRLRLGEAGRRFVLAHFTRVAKAERYLEALGALARGRSRSAMDAAPAIRNC
jgi:glycosyltransferase involved in cell wall biosynthesis